MPMRLASYPLPVKATFGEACEAAARQLLADTIEFHGYVISTYGGASIEIRSEDLLVSAVYRPFTVFGNQLLYQTGLLQAGALLYSLIQNHPFYDGNKRTAVMVCIFFLQRCGYWRGDVALLSEKERQELEALVLMIADEGGSGRATRYTVEEVAQALHEILASSQKRRFRIARIISGLFRRF